MEKFKSGDKVKFLNEKGGGTVVRLIDSRMALVSIEDGFEIPVLMSDLVIDPASAEARVKQATEVIREEVLRQEQQHAAEVDAARKSGLRRFAKNPEPEGVYMAFVPHEQQWVLTGLLDVMLINHTNTEMLYSFTLSSDEGFENVDYGQVEAFSKVVIESISREDLSYWTSGIVQALFIEDVSKRPLIPLHAPFQVKANRFFKEGSYVSSAVLGEKAVMVRLELLTSLRMDQQQEQQFQKEGRLAEASVVNKPVAEKPLIDKHRTSPGEAVVDLHIAELLENIAGLSSKDMLKIQLDYFHKTLESAMANEYDKVTFIHGVGNGVLKNAIIKALEEYEGTQNRMASMSKFGVGAIDVLIRDKE